MTSGGSNPGSKMAGLKAAICLLFMFFSPSLAALNSTLPDFLLKKDLFPSFKLNASKQCRFAIGNLTIAAKTQLIDATGKPGAGAVTGAVSWLGSYSECKTIPDSHYCLASIDIYLLKDQKKVVRKLGPIHWGLCIPQECDNDSIVPSLDQLFQVADSQLYKYNAWVTLDKSSDPVHCAAPSKYTTGPILALTVCGVILLLCLIGTVLDMVSDCSKDIMLLINTSGRGDGLVSSAEGSEADNNFKSSSEVLIRDGDSGYFHSNSTPDLMVHAVKREKNIASGISEFFLCFSLIRNTSRIMDTKVPSGAITSINGMRVLSMFWVILGHTLMTTIGTNSSNFGAVYMDLLTRFTYQALDNAFFSVDSFFFLSGLLVTYLGLRQMERHSGRIPLFDFYFHRFWRLTPTYMFVLLFYAKLMGFLGEGPVWYTQQQNPTCDKYWWTNLLYINNFYPTTLGKECMGWSWYLANDMQFYVITPLILFAAYRFGILGFLCSAGTLLMGSFVATAVIIGHYDLGVVLNGGFNQTPGAPKFSDLVYTKPYCRIAPYLVGMGLGYILHRETISTRRVPLVGILLGWIVAIVLGLSTVYGQYKTLSKDGKPFTKAENIMYGTFSRYAWGLALAWVIYACHRGAGGLVNKLLSASFWIPLSRLTYTAYLVHLIAISVFFGSFETVVAYSDVHLAFYFAGVLVISYMAAFCVSVCVEYPMMQLEKLLFKTNR